MTDKIQRDFSLKSLNTFGIECKTKFFAQATDIMGFTRLIGWAKTNANDLLILGGGSNILFTQDFDGLVIQNNVLGKNPIGETSDHIIVEFGAGESWHEVVLYCISNGWAGVENLSLIPGTVGAAPMQNIGAYGVELESVFHCLQALNRETLAIETFENTGCAFGYRQSIFKGAMKGKYIILNVTLKLSKNASVNTTYGAIQDVLDNNHITTPTIKDVSDAVISIRQSKLPDPTKIGNAGSFFKNPIISMELFDKIRSQHPEVPNYPAGDQVKLPAGWLIEKCGWKGKRIGDVGVHSQQALVLVNYGKGTGSEIMSLAFQIQESVKITFGIDLETEVNFV